MYPLLFIILSEPRHDVIYLCKSKLYPLGCFPQACHQLLTSALIPIELQLLQLQISNTDFHLCDKITDQTNIMEQQ